MDKSNENNTRKELIIYHPGLNWDEFDSLIKDNKIWRNQIVKISFDLRDEEKSTETLNSLFKWLNFYEPERFDDFLWLYKITCGVILLNLNVDNSFDKINLLHRTFQLDTNKWDICPVHLHLISKELFKLLKNYKNLLYFCRQINNISRISFYIGICLVWAGIFDFIKRDIKMYRFYKLETLIEIIENLDIDVLKKMPKELYQFLDILSFLQNIIILNKSRNMICKRFRKYFEYNENDIIILYRWCTDLKDSIKLKENQFYTEDYYQIIELLDFDILYSMEKILPKTDDIEVL